MLAPSSIPPQLLTPCHCTCWISGPVTRKTQNALSLFLYIPSLFPALHFPTVLSCSTYFPSSTPLFPRTWKALNACFPPSCLLPAFLLLIKPAWILMSSSYTIHCPILLQWSPRLQRFSSPLKNLAPNALSLSSECFVSSFSILSTLWQLILSKSQSFSFLTYFPFIILFSIPTRVLTVRVLCKPYNCENIQFL